MNSALGHQKNRQTNKNKTVLGGEFIYLFIFNFAKIL